MLKFFSSIKKSSALPQNPGQNSGTSAALPSDDTNGHPNDGLTPQEKYDYLSEYGAHILCLLNAESGCTYLSRNFESITGHACSTKLGQDFYAIVHRDYQDRLKEILAALNTNPEPQKLHCKMQHEDGKWYWYLFLIHLKHQGNAGEYVCVIENINDTVVAQNTLQKARLEAELALRSRSEFLANMSHELRTPLNAVIGFAQIIENGIYGDMDNPHYREYIRHIQESGYDLLSKIEDLLEIASIDAGQMSLNKEEVYVCDILKMVAETQAHHVHAAKVKLDLLVSQKHILLNVDRLKLQHILSHLIANALKSSAPHSTIFLSAMLMTHGLEITVRDQGFGIQEEKLAAILNALQEDNCWTTSSEKHSIGLGLALTREFVALHGGQVRIDSQPGNGTTVTITLPNDCIRLHTQPSIAVSEYQLAG